MLQLGGTALVRLLICRQGRGPPQGHTSNWCAGRIRTMSLCPIPHTFFHCCLVCVLCVLYVRDCVGVYTSVPMCRREQDAFYFIALRCRQRAMELIGSACPTQQPWGYRCKQPCPAFFLPSFLSIFLSFLNTYFILVWVSACE